MSRQRTGPIFTQEILNNLIRTMEGQIPTDQSDETVFQEKVYALQRFLHHGMSRFSTESLQQVLDSILPPRTPGTPNGRADGRPSRKMEVRSIKELRDVVKMTMTKRESGSIRASDADALKYMEHFFFAVYCMTEAKRLIDDIFADLYYSYYKPETESRQTTRVGSDFAKDSDLSAGHVTEDYSQFGISTLEQLTGSTGHKLRLTVKDMQDVLARWAELLTQEEPEPASFEPESEQDMLLVRSTFHTQPILRLLPDTFAKFYKCVELSKQWWVLAHDVYPDLPFQRHPPEEPEDMSDQGLSPDANSRDLEQEKTNLTSQIVLQTRDAIKEINSEIEAVQEEMEALSKREEKFSILVETYDKVGQDIETRTRERQQLYTRRDRLTQSGQQDASNREELQQTEAEIRQIDGTLKLLEFQHSLLLQDYLIHMEIRPSIIRFQGEAALRLRDAQIQLEQQALNLEKLEGEVSSSSSPPSVSKSEDNKFEHTSRHSPVALISLSGSEDEDKKQTVVEDEENAQAQSKVRKSSKQEMDKNHILQRSNSKRKVAFTQNYSNKANAVSSDKKPQPSSPERPSEKFQAVRNDSVLPQTKPIDRRKVDIVPEPRAKRNSLPSVGVPQKSTQQVRRRKSHEVSTVATENVDTKVPKPVVKESAGHMNASKEPAKKQTFDERNGLTTGDKKPNLLVKAKSSKDVISKSQTAPNDTKSPRTRSSSDPPVVSTNSLPKINRKASPPKAGDKTSPPSDAAAAPVLRNKVARPRPAPALKKH